MLVDHCEFPENFYFDSENDMWLFPTGSSTAKIGIVSTLLFLAGKLTTVKLRTEIVSVKQGQTIGTVESPKYFGPIRSPVEGTISGFNTSLTEDLRLINEFPYDSGWVAELINVNQDSFSKLQFGVEAKPALEARIKELKIRCLKILPDEQMYAIGSECAGTLVSLNELLAEKPRGYVVHLVTDDPTSEREMTAWSNLTGNELADVMREDNLYHFLVRKSITKKEAEHD